jgi:hypothetical protein
VGAIVAAPVLIRGYPDERASARRRDGSPPPAAGATAKVANAKIAKAAKNPSVGRVISKPPCRAEMERWRAARKDVASANGVDDFDDDFDDATRREAEIARWRERALARGETGTRKGNANLVPVVGDWRRRADAKRLRRGDAETAQSFETETVSNVPFETEPSSFETDIAAAKAGVDVAAASLGLPRGWRAYFDANCGSVYYANADSGEARWDPPSPESGRGRHRV